MVLVSEHTHVSTYTSVQAAARPALHTDNRLTQKDPLQTRLNMYSIKILFSCLS